MRHRQIRGGEKSELGLRGSWPSPIFTRPTVGCRSTARSAPQLLGWTCRFGPRAQAAAGPPNQAASAAGPPSRLADRAKHAGPRVCRSAAGPNRADASLGSLHSEVKSLAHSFPEALFDEF